ncbi:hypothetical protein BH11MYX4_BH11MYX4_14660 [soil metagenome]|nr:hypothetical protein [Labilithrix sp.]
MRRAFVVAALTALVAAAAITLPESPASAKSAYDSAYGFDRTWNAGLRLVRVDLGLKVTEKDDTNGYLLFDYKSPESGQKPVPGSMEFIKGKDGQVRVVVQIAQMPGYHEQVLVDSLSRKLRNEYGDPPKKPPMPAAPRDAGAPDADSP